MGQRYCYWSVCDGTTAHAMELCVESARKAGVFKEFHVFSDRHIPGCESYDAQDVDKEDGIFKLIYLQAGVSKLLFDYFIWIEPHTRFVRNPRNVLASLHHSPIHVPLLANLSALAANQQVNGNLTSTDYVRVMRESGVQNPVYHSLSAFWIIHRDAIDRVCELATHFRAASLREGHTMNVCATLGYAMQMLCGNPELHLVTKRPDLWACNDNSSFETTSGLLPWQMEYPISREVHEVNSSMVYLPNLGMSQPKQESSTEFGLTDRALVSVP